jgi:PPOX class probable F420-dependent enzyme
VPITFALDGDLVVTAVDHKPKRTRELKRLANIAENPQVAVLVDEYDDDWERLWWVRARGRARVLDRGEEAERALDLLVDKYEQYRSDRPAPPVLAVDVVEWRGWAASGSF